MKIEGKYILYADDDPDDQELMHEAVHASGSGIDVIGVHNGIEVIEFLSRLSKGDLYPSMIILDINMPVVGGYQALKLLQLNPMYSHIPVTIFSTSNDAEEKRKAKRFGAYEFITKPLYYLEFLSVCQKLVDYCNRQSEETV